MENRFHNPIRPRIGGKVLLVWKTAFAQALGLAFSRSIRRAIGEAVSQASLASAAKSDTLGVVYYENAIVRASVKFSDDIACIFDLELKINPFSFDDDPTTPGGAVAATIRGLNKAVLDLHIIKTLPYKCAPLPERRVNVGFILESGAPLPDRASQIIFACDDSDPLVLNRRTVRFTGAARPVGTRLQDFCKQPAGHGQRVSEPLPLAADELVARLLRSVFEIAASLRVMASRRPAIGDGRRAVEPVAGVVARVARPVAALFERVAAVLRRRQSVQPDGIRIGDEQGRTLAFG